MNRSISLNVYPALRPTSPPELNLAGGKVRLPVPDYVVQKRESGDPHQSHRLHWPAAMQNIFVIEGLGGLGIVSEENNKRNIKIPPGKHCQGSRHKPDHV